MEARTMIGFDEVGQLVDDDVLDAPFWQQKEIDAEGNLARPHITAPPSRRHRLDDIARRVDTHQLGVAGA